MYWNKKYSSVFDFDIGININMRCIEMYGIHLGCDFYGQININMRCIEIALKQEQQHLKLRLTLTWDVLKFK